MPRGWTLRVELTQEILRRFFEDSGSGGPHIVLGGLQLSNFDREFFV